MPNVDGLKKNQNNKPRLTGTPIRVKKALPKFIKVKLFSFIEPKQITTIVVTFVLTLTLSFATSQGLASIKYPEPGVPTPATPASYSQTTIAISDHPDTVPLFDQTVLTTPGEVFLPKENISLPDPLQKRKEFLQKYLTAKGSPLAAHVDAISEQSQWKLIIGISRAESSFCKHQVNNNCWGIGGAWNMKNYKNFDQAVADVNRILEQHYIAAGLDTPKEIEKKYVGYPSANWEMAVQQELDNLAEVQ